MQRSVGSAHLCLLLFPQNLSQRCVQWLESLRLHDRRDQRAKQKKKTTQGKWFQGCTVSAKSPLTNSPQLPEHPVQKKKQKKQISGNYLLGHLAVFPFYLIRFLSWGNVSDHSRLLWQSSNYTDITVPLRVETWGNLCDWEMRKDLCQIRWRVSGTKVFVLLIQCSVDFNFSERVV